VNAEIAVMSDDLARGTAKDHGDYKYACGIIRGLMMANSIFEETSRKMEEQYDD
jgi:hypothetical protein